MDSDILGWLIENAFTGQGEGVRLNLVNGELTVSTKNGNTVATVPASKLPDVGLPGFFAGRKYLEVPVENSKTIQIGMVKEHAQRLRQLLDQELARLHPELIHERISNLRHAMIGGGLLFVLGVFVCVVGFGYFYENGFSIIFYGLPVAGAALVAQSAVEIGRLKRLATNQLAIQLDNQAMDTEPPSQDY